MFIQLACTSCSTNCHDTEFKLNRQTCLRNTNNFIVPPINRHAKAVLFRAELPHVLYALWHNDALISVSLRCFCLGTSPHNYSPTAQKHALLPSRGYESSESNAQHELWKDPKVVYADSSWRRGKLYATLVVLTRNSLLASATFMTMDITGALKRSRCNCCGPRTDAGTHDCH